MQKIASLSREISSTQGTQLFGIREQFEGLGHKVGWNQDTKKFSVGDNWYDSGDFLLKNDNHLYATLQQLEDMLKNLPSLDTGGIIRKDSVVKVHEGERVLRLSERQGLDTFLPKIMDIQAKAKEGIDAVMKAIGLNGAANVQNVRNNAPVSLVQYNSLTVDGVATDQIVKNLDSKFSAYTKEIQSKVNTAIKGSGGNTPIRAW